MPCIYILPCPPPLQHATHIFPLTHGTTTALLCLPCLALPVPHATPTCSMPHTSPGLLPSCPWDATFPSGTALAPVSSILLCHATPQPLTFSSILTHTALHTVHTSMEFACHTAHLSVLHYSPSSTDSSISTFISWCSCTSSSSSPHVLPLLLPCTPLVAYTFCCPFLVGSSSPHFASQYPSSLVSGCSLRLHTRTFSCHPFFCL